MEGEINFNVHINKCVHGLPATPQKSKDADRSKTNKIKQTKSAEKSAQKPAEKSAQKSADKSAKKTQKHKENDNISSSSPKIEMKGETINTPTIKTPKKKTIDSPNEFPPYYDMNIKGRAFIFNHKTFKCDSLPNRSGSNCDCTALKHALEHLGLTVQVSEDNQLSSIVRTMKKIADADHNEYSCLVVCVLTYGKGHQLYASDTAYRPEELWKPFTSDRHLNGKPKVFFFQAVPVDATVEREPILDCVLPTQPDFLISFSGIRESSLPDGKIKGSLYVRTLTRELEMENFGHNRDMLSMLVAVAQKIATITTSEGNPSRRKTIPCFASTLTRSLVFSPIS